MSTFDADESLEYQALMARGRDAERTWQLCWTASGIAACALLSWGIAARNAGLMLPVILAVAFGFYAMVHGRRQIRMIAGYVQEYFEESGDGPQWFSRLARLQVLPGFNLANDWLVAIISNAVVAAAVVLGWLFASEGPRGELMAGIVTGCGLMFAFHSTSETAQLRRSDFAALWRQIASGPTEVKRQRRVAAQ
jgi:hypothetical protein